MVTREYINKKKKKSEKTEHVEHQLSYTGILQKLNESKWAYVLHKYQIYNDKLHWPIILQTIPTYSEIYHMDFSENLTQLFKFEPQSSHFNKSQYSLHCTVKHTGDDESPFCYIFRLSDEMKHNHAFTSAAVNDIIQKHGLSLILPFKSDNCSM